MFGGLPTRNTQVTPGGAASIRTRDWLQHVKAAGVKFCNISPMRDDAAAFLDAEWLAPRPHSDTAIMLALAHTLIVEELHDADFLARYCVGFERFRDYLIGDDDGVAKIADWAAGLSEIPADTIRGLARRMAASRSFITVNWSLQRADHGEQPILGGDRARRDARPDRTARRRFRLRLRQHGGPRGPAPGCADPVAADGPQSGAQLHSGRAHRRPAAQSGRSRSSTTGRISSIPISSWCIGAAAIRFTIIRTSTG